MKSEMKMHRDRDREVKFLENSREILRNQETQKIFNFWSKSFHLANFYFRIRQKVIPEPICQM